MAGNSRHGVGVSVPRVDGVEKVRGAAQYVDDICMPGLLHGATVRSLVPRGVLKAIDCDPTFDWSDITMVTAADIPGKNVIALIENDQPALVPLGGTIAHVDEPLALVCAPTRQRAKAAAQHVCCTVDELPPVLSVDDALKQVALIHGDDNIFTEYLIETGEPVNELFAKCDIVVEGTYKTPAQEQMYIEPQGMIAWWQEGVCHISGSMQCPFYVHKAMKELLACRDHDVVIAQTVTGGGFGGKEEYPSLLAAHAALLAKKAGAPVKIIYERDEDIAATTKRHPSLVHHKLGLMNNGVLVCCEVDVILDSGAYTTLSPVVLSRAVLHAAGPYKFAGVRIRGRAVATNYPPHGAFRGFGAPQTTFAYERQIQKAARRVGMAPFEFRKCNMLRLGDKTATGQTLEYSVGSEKVLRAVADAVGPLPPREEGSLRRGRGLCFYFHGAGFTGSGEERLAGRATLVVTPEGFEVRSSSTDIGQGARTMFAQIASSALGVTESDVSVVVPSTDRVPDSGPTVASRTCMVVGWVVKCAAESLRRRIEEWAEAHDISGSLCEQGRAMLQAQGEVREEAQYRPPSGVVWDDKTYTGSAYPVYGWATCLVDLAVDTDTGEVKIERCIQAVDVGRAINPIIVQGQIEGGTLQALGWALWENVVYQRGRVANQRMTNCIIATFVDAPRLETILVEEPYPFGPHGAKGVGEIPMDGPAAAVAGALEDALGRTFDTLPMLPEEILGAERSA